jgi:tRNA A-37 threonylcarbamoyl transferase component Bud32
MQQGWTGKTLAGRYEISDLVGHGGMSSVYKATDSNLKRIVAVKLIHQHLTGDAEFIRRFEGEAEAIAQLRHSNVIQVFDFNHEDGQYYMVMEFVPGESLQERLKRLNDTGRRMSTQDAVKIAAAVCDGVDYAHKRGLIHRDIKPANIMLSVQGDAILADFGLAKLAGATQHTAAGAVMGTALYMSPEQIRGEQVDARTDIYALGVTLFEMLSGKPPYVADSAMTVLMMHLNDPLPDLRDLNPDVPAGLLEIVEKALAKSPEERYASASEMAAALRALDTMIAPAAEPAADATMIAAAGAAASLPPEAGGAQGSEPEADPGAVASGPPPPIPPVAEDAGAGSGGMRPWMFAVAGALAVVVAIIILVLAGVFDGGDDTSGIVSGDTSATPAEGADSTPQNGSTPTEGAGVEPTEAPTVTDPPSPFARINNITLDGSTYVVAFETFGYTPTLPGMHVHFFFDTVPPEEAGVPGDGPWILYGGPSPFAEYSTGDRPEAATEMCSLVANEDHSIIVDTGNCVSLPQ